MRKRTVGPYNLNQSQISEQSLISNSSSSRSFISNVQPYKKTFSHLPASQMQLIENLGLKFRVNQSPTEMFVNFLTKQIDQATIIQECEIEHQARYNVAIGEHKQLHYLKMKQISKIDYIKMMAEQSLFGVLRKRVLLGVEHVSVFCRFILSLPLFEIITTLVIIGNSIVIAASDPLNQITSKLEFNLEIFFLSFYIFEAALKMFAYGFVMHKGSYLRDLWNIMDLLIIFTSITQFFTYIGFSANSLRVFRVLRPLRTITKVSSLKMVIKTLFASLPLVFDSIVLLGIAIIVFSIFGVQMFGGLLKFRCMNLETGIFTKTLCSNTDACLRLGQSFVCSKGISSPNYSIENFDSISWAFISIFQILTMEGWSTIMIDLQSAFNVTGAIYTVAIIFVCELALLNITLAILKYKFSEIREKGNQLLEILPEGFEIKNLKKIGAYDNFTNIKKGTFIPNILLGRVGATSLDKYPFFNQVRNRKRSKKNCQYNRVSSETKSLRNHLSYEINRASNSKNIRIFDEVIGDTYKNPISIKQIDFNIQIVGHDRDEQKDILAQSFHESEEEIKTERLMDNDNAQYQQLYEAQQKNSLMFSLLNSNGKKDINKPQVIQFIKNMQKKNIIWEFDPQNQIAQKNEQFLQIVLHKKNANEFLSMSKKRLRANSEKKSKKRMTARRSIQQLKKQQQMDLQDIKLISGIAKKELYFEINQDVSINALFQDKIKEISIGQLTKNKRTQDEKQINIIYSNVWESKKLDGFIKIPLRPVTNRIIRSNRVINTHFITDQQQDKQTENDYDPQPKQMFKITFSRNTKLSKHRFSRREVNRVFTQPQIDKLYFLNRNLESKEEQEQITRMQDLEDVNQQMLNNSAQTNEQKWNRICVEDNILSKVEMSYPPLQILKESEMKKFVNVFPQHTQYHIYIPGFFGFLQILKNYLTILVQSEAYDRIMLTLVIVNTLVLASNPDSDSFFQTTFNLILTILFTVDIVFKTIVYGLNFFQDFLNVFDLFVVILGLFELIVIGQATANIVAFRSIRVFRIFRVLRMARLIRSMSFMSVISDIVASVFYQFIYIFLVLGLFLFVYVLLGMQIFGGSFVPQKISGVRQNFDSFGSAFFAIFQLITVENWNDIEDALILSSTNSSSIIFLMAGIFIGNWVLLNLVQAILLENFEIERIKLKQQKEEKKLNKKAIKSTQHIDQSNVSQSYSLSKSKTKSKSVTFSKTFENKTITSRKTPYFHANDYSWWLFKPSSYVRIGCLKMVTSKYFTYILYTMIVVSCGKLIFDTYINHDDNLLITISNYINMAINICFFTEFILKTIAFGFVFSPKAYLKNNWNKLDFFIVICSILDFFSAANNIGIIKVFRALRPLKLIGKNLRMKIMIQALFQSANGIANVGIVVILVFLMFGILYMNLLQSKLNYCDIGKGEIYGPYNIDQTKCLQLGFIWRTRIINFQNIINSLISLYIFSTRQNWPFYHYSFVDAAQAGPALDNSTGLFIFLSFIFIFICSYFLLDLFIGVIFLNYHMTEAKLNPKILTPEQTNWIKLQKHIINTKPANQFYQAESKFGSIQLFNILKHKYYEIIISVLLGVNTVIFMMEYDDMDGFYFRSILIVNCAFTSIFLLQLIVKILAFPIQQYFISVFNVLESLIVLIGIIDFIQLAGYIQQSTLLDALKIIRIMRTFRLFRFVKTYKSLQKLLYILLYALPSIGYAASILCLYLLISSVISSTLFGNLINDYTLMIDNDSNFKDFHHALQMLFICLTGENWYYYMFASMNPEAKCADEQISCSSPYYAFFWLPFIFIGQKLIMELFVLLILDQFQDTFINENNPLGLFNDLEQIFKPAWIELADKRNWTLKASNSVDLCLKLKTPLGLGCEQQYSKFQRQLLNSSIGEEQTNRKSYQFLSKMKQSAMKWVSKLQLPNNTLHYHRSFFLFAKAVFSPEADNCTQQQLFQIQDKEQQTIETLCKMEGKDHNEDQEIMNPFKRQLLIQIALEAWVNYVDIQYHQKDKHDEDSIIMDEEFEGETLRLISNDQDNKAAKLKKATSLKIKRELSHKNSNKLKDKEAINPENWYSMKGRVSI